MPANWQEKDLKPRDIHVYCLCFSHAKSRFSEHIQKFLEPYHSAYYPLHGHPPHTIYFLVVTNKSREMHGLWSTIPIPPLASLQEYILACSTHIQGLPPTFLLAQQSVNLRRTSVWYSPSTLRDELAIRLLLVPAAPAWAASGEGGSGNPTGLGAGESQPSLQGGAKQRCPQQDPQTEFCRSMALVPTDLHPSWMEPDWWLRAQAPGQTPHVKAMLGPQSSHMTLSLSFLNCKRG